MSEEADKEERFFVGIEVERQRLAEFQRRCSEGLRRQRNGGDGEDEGGEAA